MRATIAALTLALTATPAMAQACLGGPREPGGAAVGVTVGRALELDVTETMVDFVGRTGGGLHSAFSIGGSTTPKAVRGEWLVGYELVDAAVQACPTALVGRLDMASTDATYGAAGLAVAFPFEGPLDAFAHAQLFRSWNQGAGIWAGRGTLGLVAHLGGVDVLLTGFADPEQVRTSASVAAGVRLSFAP